jgi:hypothetical protein
MLPAVAMARVITLLKVTAGHKHDARLFVGKIGSGGSGPGFLPVAVTWPRAPQVGLHAREFACLTLPGALRFSRALRAHGGDGRSRRVPQNSRPRGTVYYLILWVGSCRTAITGD